MHRRWLRAADPQTASKPSHQLIQKLIYAQLVNQLVGGDDKGAFEGRVGAGQAGELGVDCRFELGDDRTALCDVQECGADEWGRPSDIPQLRLKKKRKPRAMTERIKPLFGTPQRSEPASGSAWTGSSLRATLAEALSGCGQF